MSLDEPLLPHLAGDPARQWRLRRSLQALSAATQDPDFKKMLGDVLDGSISLRDVADSTVFDQNLAPLVRGGSKDMEERFGRLSPEEIVGHADEAASRLQAAHEAAVSAEQGKGTRPRNRPADQN